MLRDGRWSEERAYNTDTDAEPIEFYTEALSHGTSFDLLLGYFSSAAIRVLALGFAKFISTGGKMRMIINDVLGSQDKKLIVEAESGKHYQLPFDISNFAELRSRLDAYDQHFFDCLGWLIQNKRIEIRVVRPKNKKGISHYKSGVFRDGQDSIGFKGSCNFTYFGLLENLEELEIFLSWENGRSNKLIKNQTKRFESIFSGDADYAEIIDATEITEAIRTHFGKKDINELLVDERKLTRDIQSAFKSEKLKKILEQSENSIQRILEEPRFPFIEGPRDYQSIAYQRWVSNGLQGIFAMATGTGKTITALNCLLGLYRDTKSYRAIILVPTKILVTQWVKEAKAFNFGNVIQVSSANPSWKGEVSEIVAAHSFGLNTDFILIVTYASFSKSAFQTVLKKLPPDSLLIADEMHNLGSANVLSTLPEMPLARRIGLSATPNRAYDDEGSAALEQFFNDAAPYCYSFSMSEAIKQEILCEYYYYPSIVLLQPDEFKRYKEISDKISKSFHIGTPESNERVQHLLMDRKRIIHQAKNKLTRFKEIVKSLDNQNGRLHYTLIYAPEGYFSDEVELDEISEGELNEENGIIDHYAYIVRKESPETTITKYVSNAEGKEQIIKHFENGDVDVLLSMKCLDEGVDIPRTEKAIFCSSTGNPRQFIQRRGRILRKHRDKTFATIYDMVVLPSLTPSPENFELEQSLIKKELERVVSFAYMAINKYPAKEVFKEVCNNYKIELDSLHVQNEQK